VGDMHTRTRTSSSCCNSYGGYESRTDCSSMSGMTDCYPYNSSSEDDFSNDVCAASTSPLPPFMDNGRQPQRSPRFERARQVMVSCPIGRVIQDWFEHSD
jgi:hypothetical protein